MHLHKKYALLEKTGNSMIEKLNYYDVIEMEGLVTSLKQTFEKSAFIHMQFWECIKNTVERIDNGNYSAINQFGYKAFQYQRKIN